MNFDIDKAAETTIKAASMLNNFRLKRKAAKIEKQTFTPARTHMRDDGVCSLYIPPHMDKKAIKTANRLVDEHGVWRGLADLTPELQNRYDPRAIMASVHGKIAGYFYNEIQTSALYAYSKGARYVEIAIIWRPKHMNHPLFFCGSSTKALDDLVAKKIQMYDNRDKFIN